MFPTAATPPTDLDRVAAAWVKLQQLVNGRLPYSAGQLAWLRGRLAK